MTIVQYHEVKSTTTRSTIDCQAIIFDLDGVLVDSARIIRRVWRRWADARGIQNQALISLAITTRTVEAVHTLAPHLDAELEAQRLEKAEATELEGLQPVKGAPALLRSLPSQAWAIVTSVRGSTAIAKLRRAGLPEPAILVTGDHVQRGKPHPEGYLLASRLLGVPPQGCVVIEDTPPGLQAARSAGMQVIALTTTHPPEQLQGALPILPNLEDLRAEVEGGKIRLIFRSISPLKNQSKA